MALFLCLIWKTRICRGKWTRLINKNFSYSWLTINTSTTLVYCFYWHDFLVTGYKLDTHKRFRRSPLPIQNVRKPVGIGRLLNVIWTFKLYPESRDTHLLDEHVLTCFYFVNYKLHFHVKYLWNVSNQNIVSNRFIGYLIRKSKKIDNPFHANGPFLYPLKTSENQRFSDVFLTFSGGIAESLTNITSSFST